MPTARSSLGQQAENLAAEELKRRGYEIIETNFRCRYGEIDLIAKDSDTLVFVEVRSHKSTAFGLPAESITRTKQRKLKTTAQIYLSKKKLGNSLCRFDVVEVMFEDDRHSVNIIPNAF